MPKRETKKHEVSKKQTFASLLNRSDLSPLHIAVLVVQAATYFAIV
jgi:hypothetical protein